jgi:glyceraldehyde 3-phosphate dehydrogenase
MNLRVAINGFGRIGRMVYRRAVETGAFQVVAVNGTSDAETMAHLLTYDSVHGTWPIPLHIGESQWTCGGQTTRLFATRNIEELPWKELDIDVVIEATGAFRTYEGASKHLRQGAKKVLITAPAKGTPGADFTLVMGVNEEHYDRRFHHVVSGASCTTNALGPVVKAIHQAFTLEHGFLTTVHAVTNDQNNLDNPHKDIRRGRASHQSMIPTTTGAARAIGEVLPDLAGRLDGISVRVPVPNVSLIDVVATVRMPVTTEMVNEALATAALDPSFRGVLGYTEEPLVSVDFNGDGRSAVVDAAMTRVVADSTIKVLAWYDNEWAYACRMVETAAYMGAGEGAAKSVQSDVPEKSSPVTVF